MITVQTLVDLEACSDQVTLFREFLGDREGVEPTPEVIREAALYGLDIWWAQHMGLLTIPDGKTTYKDGSQSWHLEGKLHREDGPAIEWTNGTRSWRINGLRHREGGPAIEYADGSREWWLNGKHHREDGPAFEGADGHREWWTHGVCTRIERGDE